MYKMQTKTLALLTLFGLLHDVSYSENVIVMLNLSVSRASHVNALPVRTEETGLFGVQLSIDIL